MRKSRSEQMARIRSRDTSPERLLRQALWRSGIRYRVHYKTLVGRPDIVLVKAKVAIFVDGCQWHGCPEHYVKPKTRVEFWGKKLQTNFLRDLRQTMELRRSGWRVIRIWEHEIFENLGDVVRRIGLLVTMPDLEQRPEWRVTEVDALDEVGSLECRHLRSIDDPPGERCVVRPRSTAKWKRNKFSLCG